MGKRWTMEDIAKIAVKRIATKIIRDVMRDEVENDRSERTVKTVSKHLKRRSKEKDWIAENIYYWCKEHAVSLVEEHKFHKERKWRFDWAIPTFKIGIEYEGLMSEKSRHTTIKGFTADTEKYNEAIKDGWKVLRYTALNYRNLINDLDNIIENYLNEKQ